MPAVKATHACGKVRMCLLCELGCFQAGGVSQDRAGCSVGTGVQRHPIVWRGHLVVLQGFGQIRKSAWTANPCP